MLNLFLIEYIEEIDVTKPGRVNDLRVDEIDYGKKQVKMSFTAPGDNLDLGRGKF